jgi:putative endonuclease
MRRFWIYILASRNRTLYTGKTNNLRRRVAEHRRGKCYFTSKYRITRLVYFEEASGSVAATARERQIKAWTRAKRVAMIHEGNPAWDDLLPES